MNPTESIGASTERTATVKSQIECLCDEPFTDAISMPRAAGSSAGVPETKRPESTTQVDPEMRRILHTIRDQSLPLRVVLSSIGIVISGRVVDAQAWRDRISRIDERLAEPTRVQTPFGAARGIPSNSRLTLLQERLRWGTGLTYGQFAELRAGEGTRNADDEYVHLVEVMLLHVSPAKLLPTWRGRLSSVDGFSILQNGAEAEE